MRLLDSDVLIDLIREFLPAHAWLRTIRPVGELYLPGFAVMELVDGARNRNELNRFMRGITHLPIVWPHEDDCDLALSDFSRFHLSHGLSPFDALIARTAIGLGATLCTFNVKHFQPIVGLVTEQPYER